VKASVVRADSEARSAASKKTSCHPERSEAQ